MSQIKKETEEKVLVVHGDKQWVARAIMLASMDAIVIAAAYFLPY